MKNRQFPQAIEAEESILSSCLLGSEDECCECLKPEDFYKKAHQVIFQAVSELQAKGQPVESNSVVQKLREAGNLETAGGASYIAMLTDVIPIATSISHYANLIKQASTRRQVIAKGQEIVTKAYDNPDFESLINEVQRAFSNVDIISGGECFTSYRDLAESMPDKWEALGDNTGLTGIPSGLSPIDRITGGFQHPDLIIIAARPGMGKTALCSNIAEGAARNGHPVFILSLEMSCEQLYSRQTAKTAKIDSQKFRLGGIQTAEWQRILDAQNELQRLPIYIDDTPRQHYMEIIRRSRRAAREHGIELIIIDYLQLIRGDGNQRKDLEVGDITGALKGLAKELNVPVVLLSQLNRGAEGRDDKRPRLSDLRESGAIEQDADIVIFIYRDEYYNKETMEQGIAEINFAKHRNGRTGPVKLRWLGWRSSFENL
ncbi:DnaC: replicative DNA helicase [Desulfosarcina variabilis str. Montpellier]|uniref:replicative DNA helicase n=1 Tax=Desulfosarcina variabilis TaxID=2300 RepID=UPI003AFA7E0C